MKQLRQVLLLAWGVTAVLLAGCSGGATNEAMKSDVNGYFCKKCAHKFFTEREVYAEHCPKCQTVEITEVLGFLCQSDKHVTLAPRGVDRAPCMKCGKIVNEMKLPQEPELKSWGATKENATTVTQKR